MIIICQFQPPRAPPTLEDLEEGEVIVAQHTPVEGALGNIYVLFRSSLFPTHKIQQHPHSSEPTKLPSIPVVMIKIESCQSKKPESELTLKINPGGA